MLRKMEREILNMMCEDKEIWVDIKETDGLYQVSQYGNVRSWNKNGWGIRSEPNLLSPHKVTGGIAFAYFLANGEKVLRKVNILVALYFIENPNNYNIVDHINGDTTNNSVSNLRWVSRTQNSLNSKRQSNNTSGYKGVYCSKRIIKGKCYEYWVSSWHENGVKRKKWFKTKEEAIVFRQMMVEEHYSKDHYIEDR